MRKKTSSLVTLILCFFIFTILILTVDRGTIGVTNKEVGLISINKIFFKESINDTCKTLSNIFLYIAILLIIAIFVYTLIMFCKYKKMLKDSIIFFMGIIVVMIVWIIFDKLLIINYRPILIDGKLEGSYPSTHSLIITYVYFTGGYWLVNQIKKYKELIFGLSIILVILGSCFRLLSGYHWFTDIVGGVLLGLVIFNAYVAINEIKKEE